MIVLANKSIMTHGFTSWSVSVMISSLNDIETIFTYGNPTLLKFATSAIKMTSFTIHQKSKFLVQSSQYKLSELMLTNVI